MPDLPKVSQDFEADATAYLAAIEEMIEKNGDLIESIRDVQAEIDSLHGKNIEINLNADDVLEQVAEIREYLDGIPDEKTIRINTVYSSEGGAGDGASAVNDLTDALDRNAEAWSRVGEVGDENAARLMESMRELIADGDEVGGTLDRVFAVASDGAAELKTATAAVKDFYDGLERIDSLGPELEASIKETGDAADALGVQVQDSLNTGFLKAEQVSNGLAAGLKAIAPAAKDAEDAWTTLGNVSFTAVARMNSIGGIIHWIVAGGSELAATLLPAMVALGAGASVMLEGFGDMYTRMSAVNVVGQSIGQTFGKTDGQILGLGDSLQKAQTAADPKTFELLGAAINGVNASSGQFVAMGNQLVPILDQFAAKIDVDLKSGMTQFTGLIGAGTQDLVEFGQILGNIGHALLNFASDMPGLAEVLLKVIDGISGVILWLSKLPPWIITTVMVIEELFRWGGLLVGIFAQIGSAIAGLGFLGLPIIGKIVTQFGEMFQMLALGAVGFVGNLGKMVTGIGSFVTGAENAGGALTGFDEAATASIMGVSTGMIGLGVAAAAGFAALIIWAAKSKSATQQWTDSLVSAVNSAKGLQQIGQTYTSLGEVTSALTKAQATLGSQMADSADKVPAYAVKYSGEFVPAVTQTANTVNTLSAAQKQLSADFGTEIGNVSLLASKYKIGYVEAAELAGDAGASLTQTMKGNTAAAQENLQMVENYVQGLGGMGAVQGALGGDINAVTVATDLQSNKVQQLTQSWSAVMSLVQGPSSGFLSIAQSLVQFSTDAGQAGATMTGLGGTIGKVVDTFPKMNQASIQLQQDFNSTVSSMQTYTNSLMTAASVTGNGGPLIQGIKDQIAILVPMAGSNASAAAQIKVLWQEAGGNASDSLKQIGTAVSGIKDPLTNLQNLTGQVALSLSNLGQDASNLAQTISSSLNQTLVSQAEQLTGVSAKSEIYLQALQTYGPNSAQAAAALNNMNSATSKATALASEAAAGVTALSGNIQKMGSVASQTEADRTAVNNDIATMEKNAPNAATDIGKLSAAIQSTSGNSSAGAGIRAQLIKDLENAGVQAKTATTMVDNLAAAIAKLQNKTVTITTQEITTGGGASAGINPSALKPAASGWLVSGGTPGKDSVPILAMPGEAVVPKHLVSAVAPILAAGRVPGFASGGLVAPMTAPIADPTGLSALQTQIAGTTSNTAAYNATANLDQAAVSKATAALATAKATLGTDEKGAAALKAAETAAKSVDTKAASTLKAAESAEATAKSHMTTIEKMKKSAAQEDALAAAKKIYDSDAGKVTRDKEMLAVAAKLVTADGSKLSGAENTVRQDNFTLWQKQISLTEAQASAAQATLRTDEATKQLDALQKIQAGTAGISSLNSLLLPGTPLATLTAAMPGVGLSWGSASSVAAALPAPIPIGTFDSGGFLPPGLSLAVNGTGAPEAVGGGPGGGELHSHINVHLDGQQIWGAVQKETLRKNIRNNGVATGLMKPR